MMLDSLFESVPSCAPRSARRMISSPEPWSFAGGPTKGRTTSAQSQVTGRRTRRSQRDRVDDIRLERPAVGDPDVLGQHLREDEEHGAEARSRCARTEAP